MTTITGHSNQRPPARGMTLMEIMISLALITLFFAGAISAVDFTGRSALGILNYTQMNTESRTGLELFSRDARMAVDVTAFSTTSVTFLLPAGGGTVTYAFDDTTNTFVRNPSVGNSQVLMTRVDELEFERFNLLNQPASNNLETKQIQLQSRMERRVLGRFRTTDSVISARFILRNKRVSN